MAPRLAPLVRAGSVVVPMQNGVEAAGHLAAALGGGPVLGGLCYVFAWIESPGIIRHVGAAPRVTIGERAGGVTQRVERFCATLRRAGADVTASQDVEAATWEKFLFIDPFGAVATATRSPAGAFRNVPEARAVLAAAMREVDAVARARGVRMRDGAVDRALAIIDGLPADGTASMQRDILGGRRSELLEQAGAVVRIGRASGVPTPVHDVLFGCLLPQELAARAAAERP